MSLRAYVQQRLERGNSPRGSRAIARVWGALVSVERPLRTRKPVLCIGGATLGGSGRTPLAIACARHLAERGHRVALVGHAYRARPERARVVGCDDALASVGDEALECALALRDAVSVVVAPRRQAAIEMAEVLADVLVLDGPLQLSPTRATLALLALDPTAPWGSGACPPAGDLRAPRASLLRAADMMVSVTAQGRGAWLGKRLVRWSELQPLRIGLVTSIGRPDRVVRWLASQGIVVVRMLFGADHDPLPTHLSAHSGSDVDLWVTTNKDWARFPVNLRTNGEVARLEYHLNLPDQVTAALHVAFPRRAASGTF